MLATLNTRDRGEKQGRARVRAGYFEPALAVKSLLKSADGAGLHRADIAQEAQVAVAALQASAQGEGCPGMNTTYTVKHIQMGLLSPRFSLPAHVAEICHSKWRIPPEYAISNGIFKLLRI